MTGVVRHAADVLVGASRVGAWARPVDWLPLPAVSPTEQKVVMLIAVPEGGAYLSYVCTGKYTVDWGDGSAPENFDSDVQANHVITWASVGDEVADGGWRQAIVTITPQAGQTITSFIINVRHPSTVAPYRNPILEVEASLPSATYCSLRDLHMCRSARMLNCAVTNATSFFYENFSMVECVFRTSGTLTNINTMFYWCLSLRELPPLDTSSVTTFQETCYSNTSLSRWPGWSFASATDTWGVFSWSGLEEVPDLDMPLTTTVQAMFLENRRLNRVGNINAPNATNCLQFFKNCHRLKSIGTLNLPAATTFSELCNECRTLRSIAGITTSPALLNCATAFYFCRNLRTIPVFDTSGVTNASYMFGECLTLGRIGAFDLSAATNLTGTFDSLRRVGRVLITGISQTCSLQASLDAAGLNEVYTNLATVVGKTITVTGNPGTTGDDPSIATAKGWTVTG